MTVEELIEALRAMPPTALVIIDNDGVEIELTPWCVYCEKALVLIACEEAPGLEDE